MSDTTVTPIAPSEPADSQSQLVTALAIVGGLVSIGLGLLIAGCITGQWAILSGGIGTVVGALATALNAPSGIGAVLKSAKSNPTTSTGTI